MGNCGAFGRLADATQNSVGHHRDGEYFVLQEILAQEARVLAARTVSVRS